MKRGHPRMLNVPMYVCTCRRHSSKSGRPTGRRRDHLRSQSCPVRNGALGRRLLLAKQVIASNQPSAFADPKT